MIMTRNYGIIWALAALTCSVELSAQTVQERIVGEFGDNMSSWCQTGNAMWREKIEQLVEGVKGCRVDDGIMQLFVKRDTTSLLSQGTAVVDNYLNGFDKAIENGLSYKHGKPVWQEGYVEPVAYSDKTEAPLYFVSMDVETNGDIDYNGTDLFFVRGGQITKIIDFGGDNSLAAAIRLYSSHQYEEAFRIFRKLAYEDPNNYDAQYYTAVMEIKRQGCGFLSKKVRDIEAAWWVTRGTLSWYSERFDKLYARFTVDETLLPFSRNKDFYVYCLSMEKLVTEGLMAYQVKGKYGYINEQGNVVIPCKYDIVLPFWKNGRAWVKKDGKIGYIDKQGNEVVRVQYDHGMSEFIEGKTFVLLNGSLLLIDEQGNLLKAAGEGYDSLARKFYRGKAYAHNVSSGMWDLYDTDGNMTSTEEEVFSIDFRKNCFYTDIGNNTRMYEQPFWE